MIGLDIAKYQWVQSPDDPAIWQRGALAGENLWIQRPKESREIFVGGSITTQSSYSSSDLNIAAHQAWQTLRYEYPELCLTAHCADDGARIIEFCCPQSEEDVQRWAKKTLNVVIGINHVSFSDLRQRLCQWKADASEPAFLYLHIHSSSTSHDTSIDFILNLDHSFTDGIGARILTGRYLHFLAMKLSSPAAKEPLHWPTSFQNLSPPWANMMNDRQKTSGKTYHEAVKQQQHFLLSETSNYWGLPLSLAITRPALQKTYSRTLSQLQSTLVLHAVKHVLGSDATITHLAHGAMVVAMLWANPLPVPSPSPISLPLPLPIPSSTPTPQPLNVPCWMNGRPFLDFNQTIGTKSPWIPRIGFIPVCQAMGEVRFADLHAYATPKPTKTPSPSTAATASTPSSRSHTISPTVLPTLVQASIEAKASYLAIKARHSILSESLPLMEMLGESMFQDSPSAVDDSLPLPQLPCHAVPFLLSDGLTERFVEHEYLVGSAVEFTSAGCGSAGSTAVSNCDSTSTSTSTSHSAYSTCTCTSPCTCTSTSSSSSSNTSPSAATPLTPPTPATASSRTKLSITKLQFAANAEGPNVILRVSTWRDELTIAAEWRDDQYDPGLVERFVDDVVGLILLFGGERGGSAGADF